MDAASAGGAVCLDSGEKFAWAPDGDHMTAATLVFMRRTRSHDAWLRTTTILPQLLLSLPATPTPMAGSKFDNNKNKSKDKDKQPETPPKQAIAPFPSRAH